MSPATTYTYMYLYIVRASYEMRNQCEHRLSLHPNSQSNKSLTFAIKILKTALGSLNNKKKKKNTKGHKILFSFCVALWVAFQLVRFFLSLLLFSYVSSLFMIMFQYNLDQNTSAIHRRHGKKTLFTSLEFNVIGHCI